MHSYSISLSAIATFFSLKVLKLFQAGFSCRNNHNLSQKSSGSDQKNRVFEKAFFLREPALTSDNVSKIHAQNFVSESSKSSHSLEFSCSQSKFCKRIF